MIVGSLVLILSAAGLLAGGLILGSDWLLGASIVASLIAAVMLYIGARQSVATRAERRAAAEAWEPEEPVEEFDRRDSYPATSGRGGYEEADPYDAGGRGDEARFPDRGRYEPDERYDLPDHDPGPHDHAPAVQEHGPEVHDQGPEVPNRVPGEDRFADLRQYEDAAFSAQDTAGYDRRAGYPEPPVIERTWDRGATERVPLQRDANGADPEAGEEPTAATFTEPTPTAEQPIVVPSGPDAEPVTGQHAAAEPPRIEPPGTEPAPVEPEPVAVPEAPLLSAEARQLEQLPPDEWVGGGIDDEDPKDEPPIQRRTARVAAAVARMVTEVFVIDGRPRYHVAGCVHLLGRESEPLPADEAVDLGFSPCSLCEPDTVLTSGSPEKARH